jgi:tetratricopeptide (TPR) repeat protein
MEKNSRSNMKNNEARTCEVDIINSIQENHPECLAPGLVVDKSYIKLVLDTWNRIIDSEIGLDDSSMDDDIADEEAEEILQKIPQDAISQPLACETIRLIMAESNAVSTMKFLLETADEHCARACEFNNRANARSELGRYLEAQIDYNRACDIDPNEPTYFLNRAGLFVQLGLIDDAMRDCLHVATLLKEDDVRHYDDLFTLASIFWQCGERLLAIQSLLNYLGMMEFLIPYATQKEEGSGYRIEKNGCVMHVAPNLIEIERVAALIKTIEDEMRGGNRKLRIMVDRIKERFSILKDFADII